MHPRRVFVTLYLSIFLSSLGLGLLSPILPLYVDRFSVSSLTLGMVFGAYSASRSIFMAPIGYLSDRYGRRAFIITGLLLFTLLSPLYILARGPLDLMAVRFLQGIAAAMLLPVAMSYVGDMTPHGREGFVMGTFTSAFFAGLGFGPLIGGLLEQRYGMQAPFLGMGMFSLAALAYTVTALPPAPPPASTRRHSGGGLRAMAGDRRLLGLLLFRFTRALGIGFVWVFLPVHAVNNMGIGSFGVGLLLSANTFVTTFLQSPMGHLSDRVGHLTGLSLGSITAALALMALPLAHGFTGLMATSLALGLAGALVVPSGSALALEIGRTRGMGSIMGLYNTSLSLGTMLGPLLAGAVTDRFSVTAVFPMGGALGLAGWAGCLLLFARDGGRKGRAA